VTTPFPATPTDVVPLSVEEFTFEWDDAPSIDAICRKFVDDENRALVWLIRFRALTAWRARSRPTGSPNGGARAVKDACEVAAGFDLNDHWEFDAERFCVAVDRIAGLRSHRR